MNSYQLESTLIKQQQATVNSAKEWAENQVSLGNLYLQRIRGNKAENIERAIASYQQALTVYNSSEYLLQWSQTILYLSQAYLRRYREDRLKNSQKAIKLCQEALLHYHSDDSLKSQLYTNLGNANLATNQRDNLSNAIEAYQKALAITNLPNLDWSMLHKNLGDAHLQNQNYADAIASYQHSLTIITEDNHPKIWGDIQHRLGDAYSQQSLNQQAISHYQYAQKIYTKKCFPLTWANLQEKLANCYTPFQPRLGIKYYKQVSEIKNQEAYPEEWESLQKKITKLRQDLGILKIDIGEAIKQSQLILNWTLNQPEYNLALAYRGDDDHQPPISLTRHLTIDNNNYQLEVIITPQTEQIIWYFSLRNLSPEGLIPSGFTLRLLGEDESVYREDTATYPREELDLQITLDSTAEIIWETQPVSNNYNPEILSFSTWDE